MKADYWNPVRVKFGRGALDRMPDLLGDRRALLVAMPGVVEDEFGSRVEKICAGRVAGVVNNVVPNPTIASITECSGKAAAFDFEAVIGIGGGSALDTAKVVALLRGGPAGPDWLGSFFREGKGGLDDFSPLPLIAVPTTSGTGSEVTPWATVWDEKLKKKYSLADGRLFPEWALLDPDLTDSLPYDLTLFGSLDALSHAMEAVWNRNANQVSTELALRAVEIILGAWREDFRNRYADPRTRERLQLASLLAGLAFSNTKTALAHSISYPLTALLDLPHGLACGFTLPEIMLHNGREEGGKLSGLARALGGSTVPEAAAELYAAFEAVGVGEVLKRYIEDPAALETLEAEYISPGRADNNIASVDQDRAREIAVRAAARITGS